LVRSRAPGRKVKSKDKSTEREARAPCVQRITTMG
jgi:hypothetical protein